MATEKDHEDILNVRNFLAAHGLDSITVRLESDTYGDNEIYHSGTIALSEEGIGHFRFQSSDLEELALAAEMIAGMADMLAQACRRELAKSPGGGDAAGPDAQGQEAGS